MAPLTRLQEWYRRQCNGEWEHQQGITIASCDNPGWWVKIDLKGTKLATFPFQGLAENVDADGFQKGERWLYCKAAEGVWSGAGDETTLERILEEFLTWAEDHGS